MIISHKYQFIFLKTNKTAGTSIEIALSKFCGSDDIITPISSEDEAIRRRLGYQGQQNYLADGFYNHISAKEIKTRIGKKVWQSYYKFCFERNPWDRIISLYYWCNQSEPRPTLAEFIRSDAPLLLKKKGYELYTIDGKIAVDKLCKFENISEELEQIRNKVGIPEKLELPRAKSQFRTDKRSYAEILIDEDRDKIATLFRDEINLLGYKWSN